MALVPAQSIALPALPHSHAAAVEHFIVLEDNSGDLLLESGDFILLE